VSILREIQKSDATGQRHALGALHEPCHLLEQAVKVPEAFGADGQVDAPEEPVPISNEAALFRPRGVNERESLHLRHCVGRGRLLGHRAGAVLGTGRRGGGQNGLDVGHRLLRHRSHRAVRLHFRLQKRTRC